MTEEQHVWTEMSTSQHYESSSQIGPFGSVFLLHYLSLEFDIFLFFSFEVFCTGFLQTVLPYISNYDFSPPIPYSQKLYSILPNTVF